MAAATERRHDLASAVGVVLAVCLWSLSGVEGQIANLTTFPKGWNAAKCPNFKAGACTFSNCYAAQAGFFAKFRSFNLKRSQVKQQGVATVQSNVSVALNQTAAQAVESVVAVKTQGDCCWQCARTPGCVYWQWIPHLKKPCYLLTSKIEKSCEKPIITYGTTTAEKRRQILTGGKCNAKVEDDPHFVGARGTPFDFNGQPDRSFCLLTDVSLYVNILLRGYVDERVEGATVQGDGKAIRTWIKEVGIVWRAYGAVHRLRMAARTGKQQARGDGFLRSIDMDGSGVPLLPVGSRVALPGGLAIEFKAVEKSNQLDVDYYNLKIDGLVDMDLRLRVAHPSLQSPTEDETHFNIGFNYVAATEAVHGVLGQTYREDHEKRAADFATLAQELHAPIVADAASGKGFLDGKPADYVSSSVLSTDCVFSAFGESPHIVL